MKIQRKLKVPKESPKDHGRITQKEKLKASNKSKEYIFEFIIEPDEDGFHAYSTSLKGCRTWGHTEEEAYKNVKEVLELYLEALIDEGDPIPDIGIIENIKDIKPVIKIRKEVFV
jgi:predicted RNase H-like HicB family nuclease